MQRRLGTKSAGKKKKMKKVIVASIISDRTSADLYTEEVIPRRLAAALWLEEYCMSRVEFVGICGLVQLAC